LFRKANYEYTFLFLSYFDHGLNVNDFKMFCINKFLILILNPQSSVLLSRYMSDKEFFCALVLLGNINIPIFPVIRGSLNLERVQREFLWHVSYLQRRLEQLHLPGTDKFKAPTYPKKLFSFHYYYSILLSFILLNYWTLTHWPVTTHPPIPN